MNWLMTEMGSGDERAPYVTRIASVGRRLPDHVLTTDELMSSTRHRTGIDLERLTGIRERRVSIGDDDSLSLATAAAIDCLERVGCDPADVDVVLSCSITKYRGGLVHQMEPPFSTTIARAIGATGATAFDVSNACAGMLTGVFLLDNWIRLGKVRKGLVVSGEFISGLGGNAARHVRSIASRELASLTLGDAGAAYLLERAPDGSPGIEFAGFTTIARHSRLCLGGPARHDPGARMFTRSQALQKAAIADTPALLQEVLDDTGLTIEDIDHVIPHQTSARAIRKGMHALGEALGGLPQNPAVVTVDRFGNSASTTHGVALVEELEAGRIRAGERVALLALASGLEIGVVLFTVDEGLVASHAHVH